MCATRQHMDSSKCIAENEMDASSQLSSFPCKEIPVRYMIILVANGFSLFQDMPCPLVQNAMFLLDFYMILS